MRKAMKIVGLFVLILVLLVVGYVLYMILTYHRIEDNLELSVDAPKAVVSGKTVAEAVKTGQTYRILTYNIGFGAYTPDYSFFMDGGKSSWAASKESVIEDVTAAAGLVKSMHPDFFLLQEIDIDSTRSYHVNEYALIRETLGEYYSVFAQNYDSSFLAFPPTQPHGFCRAGLGTYSLYEITSSLRRSFPVADSLNKFLDLDRCYSISRIPTDNGKELVIMNLHMSAYGNDATIREGQISKLCRDMEKEYKAGNYVICGGDFNHDLKALEDDGSERNTWAYPFPRTSLPEHFSFSMDGLSEEERNNLWNSSRNADIPYEEGVSYTVMLDGFIVSDNVECISYESKKTGYAYSDHDPVVMEFVLQ